MSDGELMRYSNGEVVPKHDRAVARRAKAVHDEVRLAAFKADGALALGGHIMDGVVGLDQHRRALAKNDPVLNTMLAEIEATAVQSAAKIQADLYKGWNI